MKFTLGMGLLALAAMLFADHSAESSARNFCPISMKARSGYAELSLPAPGPRRASIYANKARLVLADFPEVTQVVSQVGRPDDGSDASGFYNTEFFVDLLPREKWRKRVSSTKDELIAAMDKTLSKFPASTGISRSRSPTTWKKPSAA